MKSEAQPGKKRTAKGRARKVLEKPSVLGWKTSDDDELSLRHWRGRTEIAGIEALEPEHGFFGAFRVRSSSDNTYEVEIRDLTSRNNSCGCTDHRVNGCGTCKHIEGVLAALRANAGHPPLQCGGCREHAAPGDISPPRRNGGSGNHVPEGWAGCESAHLPWWPRNMFTVYRGNWRS